MFRSVLLILGGNATASALLLARNLIVARLIPVEDYGIAATFAVTMAVVEMASTLGLQQQIVQARGGDDPRFQAALQGFQMLRGVLAGALMFAIAGPVADFLGIPQVTWAYRVMALVPILNAAVHFDIYRLSRTMVYLPGILSAAVPALLSLLAVWPLTAAFGDYRVMLWAIVLQAAAMALTSHLVARRPYRLVLDRKIMAQSLGFGWPLLLNGALLFAVFNGEKVIVGRELGMVAFAIFAMGFTLTLTPTLVMANSIRIFFLPQLSAAAEQDGERFTHLAAVTQQASLMSGAVLVFAVVLAGAPLVHLLLPKYGALVPLLVWLAILQGVRVFKTGSAVVALARGQTGNAMAGNLPRVASLVFSWYAIVNGAGLLEVTWIAIGGECCGFAVSLWLVRRRLRLSLAPMRLPLAGAALFLALVTLAAEPWAPLIPAAAPGVPSWSGAAAVGIAFLLLCASMTEAGRYLARRTMNGFDS